MSSDFLKVRNILNILRSKLQFLHRSIEKVLMNFQVRLTVFEREAFKNQPVVLTITFLFLTLVVNCRS